MRITSKAFPIISITEADANDLMISMFTAMMKSVKAKNPNDINHFFRVRLKERKHRAVVNAALNAICMSLQPGKGKKYKPVLDSVKASDPLKDWPVGIDKFGLPNDVLIYIRKEYPADATKWSKDLRAVFESDLIDARIKADKRNKPDQ